MNLMKTILFLLLTLFPLTLWATPEDEEHVNQFMEEIRDLSREEQIDALFLQANDALLQKKYTLAIAYAERARALAPTNPKVVANADSIIRIANAQIAQEEAQKNQQEEKVNWSTDDNIIDRNRYLFLASLQLDNYTFRWERNPTYARAGLGINLEGYLPFMDKQFGFALAYSSQFIDFSFPKIAKDFINMRYDAFFVWRTTWRIPAVEIQSTIALKFGVSGQYIIPLNHIDPDIGELPEPFILPKFALTFQDAIIGRFIPNNFTKNLYLNANFGLEYLPFHRTKESIALEFSLGLFYSLGNISFGPLYHFRYHRLIRANQVLSYNRWAFTINYTVY
ncbi:hypothetical protein [Entomospira culicis]|uniref:Outer membrane protein beta-barrel domain-containing protein n=1 Tax=Entomospira culicis TaxID=2719989 RepID=A0A968GIA2_9SPIO|nr:hypothetical protein [Entomospira culicis]NIZ19616.1 hypothetical protein [Entomospira culicis]NIZ69479.1 hypothetical protein [Entomospira culicis]WDI36594.1 hypothetical protein PVA46_04525 [Entomospira culicis]WDI38222.1 hypothetical protein PVA47_04535 [Entomospira culicis]